MFILEVLLKDFFPSALKICKLFLLTSLVCGCMCVYTCKLHTEKNKKRNRERSCIEMNTASRGFTKEEEVEKGSNIGLRQHEGWSNAGGQ